MKKILSRRIVLTQMCRLLMIPSLVGGNTSTAAEGDKDGYGLLDEYSWADEFHTVYLLVDPKKPCKPCEEAKKELTKKPLPFRLIVTDKDIPAWIEGYPTFWWNDVNGKGVIVEGWYGTDRLLERWKLSQQPGYKNEKAAPAVPKIRAGLYYPGSPYPSIRMWPGDLYYHLSSVHGINAANFSPEQAEAAHDAAHGKRVRKRKT